MSVALRPIGDNGAYRDPDQGLRCFAHLIRKAHGLEESFDAQARQFGRHVLDVLETVIAAVYDAPGDPAQAEGAARATRPLLNALLEACRGSPPVPCT
ncbi:hypothetical protein CKO31_25835, partial [Thiohalocapsa halophila]|nr:hypothetical protein [Thiohalocapsa halophila]